MSLVYFCLSCAGLTQILVYGKILENLRPVHGWLGQLFSCSMCTGFWSGIFLWSVNKYTELFNFDYSLVTALVAGCIGSLSSYVFDAVFDDDGIKIENR
jgi:hypothetical protein|tara:strand:- start:420 stop:716 length:297 start_codon:yes stop_codon:yes gene_type:complete